MNKKQVALLSLSGMALSGCALFDEAVTAAANNPDTVEAVVDQAVGLATGVNPLLGLGIKVLGTGAAAFLAYKTGIHKPFMNVASVGVGCVGDVCAVVGKAVTGQAADILQTAEDKLKTKKG